MNILYSEQSQRTRSAELLVVVFVILLVGAMGFTTYRSIAQGHILLSEYFIEIMALIVIVKQAVSRYTYILTDSEFIIKEKSFFRKRTYSVKYDDIDGIYAYNRDFLTNLRYRYKYRKCSTSDDRPIWFMVLKAEDAFYETLEQFVPNRVRVPEADVIFYATVRADAVKQGIDVKEYYDSLIKSAEEQEQE